MREYNPGSLMYVRGLRQPPHEAGSRAAPDELPASEERRAGDRSQANRPIQPCAAGELVVGFGASALGAEGALSPILEDRVGESRPSTD